MAKNYTSLGLSIGIGGMLLSKYDDIRLKLEDAVVKTPIEYILLETDGPYVKPDPARIAEGNVPGNGSGSFSDGASDNASNAPKISSKKMRKARNTSLILPAVARRVAELKGLDQSEVERITAENVARIFALY